jgi:ABC-type branched-subunit amino acid transport system substrate-binding protein
MVGLAIADGAKDYFNYINDQGGINGRKIKFIAEDDKYEPPTAIASLKKLITRDNIFACISTSGTPITAALTSSIEREKLPSFCTIAASSIFFPKPPAHIFSFGPYYSENMVFNIEYALNNIGKKNLRVAILYQDDEFGMEGKKGFDLAVNKYHLNVVATEQYSRRTIDLSSQIRNIKSANPDYLFVTTIPSHSIMVLKEAKKAGLNIPIFGVSNTRYEQVIQVAGEAAANFYTTEYTALPDEKDVPGMANLMALWYKKNPKNTVPARYYILSQVNAIILVEAINRCGKDLTRENLMQKLESMNDFDTKGITGKITYSPGDHCPLSAMRIVKANPQTLRYDPVTNWGYPSIRVR